MVSDASSCSFNWNTLNFDDLTAEKALELIDAYPAAEGVDEGLVSRLKGEHSWEVLDLSERKMNVAEIRMIASMIRRRGELRVVRFSGCFLDDSREAGLGLLGLAFHKHPSLREVDLSKNPLGDAIKYLCLTHSFSSIHTMDLRSCRISEGGKEMLLSELASIDNPLLLIHIDSSSFVFDDE